MPANPILATGDVVELTIKARSLAQGQEVINRNYFVVSGTPGVAVETLAQALIALGNNWNAIILPILNAEVQVVEFVLKRVSGVSPFPAVSPRLFYDSAVSTFPVAAFGGRVGTPAPSFIASSIRFLTGFVGRYWRGGMRLGTMTAGDVSIVVGLTNKWTAGYLALLQAAVTAWRVPLVTAGGNTYALGVLSVVYWNEILLGVGPALGAFAPLIGSIAGEYVRHQDSREAPKVP